MQAMFRVITAALIGTTWYEAGAVIAADEIPADRAKYLVRACVLEPIVLEPIAPEPPRRQRTRDAAGD